MESGQDHLRLSLNISLAREDGVRDPQQRSMARKPDFIRTKEGYVDSSDQLVTNIAQDEEFQCDIIIVNSDGAGEETERRHEMIEAEIKTTYEGGKPVRHKGPVKQIRFLSLLEYLSTHDWSGEFTEEEVRPWTCLM